MPYVDHRGRSIFYEDVGAGPVVVLGHSFLCTGSMWRRQVPVLAERYRVLNLDLRGHGRSGEVRETFTLYDAVGDVVAVLDHLGVDRAVWCGLSIGGMVALRAALVRPERVAALALLDTDAGAEAPLRKLKYSAMGVGARLLGIGPFLPAVVPLMFGAAIRQREPALVEAWKQEASVLRVPSVLRVLEALLGRDSLLDRLDEISVPALVLVGEEDRSLPPVLSRRLHRRMRASTLIEVAAAGHLSALEQPAAVTGSLLEFLARQAW